MSLFFDNENLFDPDGHLTDGGLYALKDGTLDDLGALEAAEHLSFCDYCLLRYTALVDTAPACLQTPMRDLIPQVQNLMRLRRFRLLTNRYVSAAAAVVLAFALWRFAPAPDPAALAARRAEAPRASISTMFGTAVDAFYENFYKTVDGFTQSAQAGLARWQHTEGGPLTAKGE